MKNLPQSKKGFTLVELLVVVAIIAILSVIGITVFSGVQKNARDARRRADVDAIATAIEAKKIQPSVVYAPIVPADFASGIIPVDTTTARYCIATSTTTPAPGNPTTWAATSACATVPATTYTAIPTAGGVPAVTVVSWKVCARLETGTSLNVYCKSSSQ